MPFCHLSKNLTVSSRQILNFILSFLCSSLALTESNQLKIFNLCFFQKNEAFTNALSGYVHDGQPVAICCGTNAWSNFAGNPDMAFNNMFSAVKVSI